MSECLELGCVGLWGRLGFMWFGGQVFQSVEVQIEICCYWCFGIMFQVEFGLRVFGKWCVLEIWGFVLFMQVIVMYFFMIEGDQQIWVGNIYLVRNKLGVVVDVFIGYWVVIVVWF